MYTIFPLSFADQQLTSRPLVSRRILVPFRSTTSIWHRARRHESRGWRSKYGILQPRRRGPASLWNLFSHQLDKFGAAKAEVSTDLPPSDRNRCVVGTREKKHMRCALIDDGQPSLSAHNSIFASFRSTRSARFPELSFEESCDERRFPRL